MIQTETGNKTDLFLIVNDIKNFVFGPAKAPVYGFGRNRKQKFVMSFTIIIIGCFILHVNHIPAGHCNKYCYLCSCSISDALF